jgi:thiol-disulfide isomerase/thioredoxin
MTLSLGVAAQLTLQEGKWHAALQRQDGHEIPFELEIRQQHGKFTAYLVNGKERMKTEEIILAHDSAIIRMPVFESVFKARVIGKDSLHGVWVNGGAAQDEVTPFTASAGEGRFPAPAAGQPASAAGKWKITFTRPNQTKRYAIGLFTQQGNVLSGSVLTPSGDYRYLQGLVSNDSMFLSTFDGAHAFLFAAKVHPDSITGIFYAGASGIEPWSAVKDANVSLGAPAGSVKEGQGVKLDFSFKDLEGNTVSLQDERYKGKVVVLQLMGSWCPNCMDETEFLSDYYRRNKARGVEVIALSYELSRDSLRSVSSLRKFQQRFNVQYPMLYTGATAGDPDRTGKTLPQLSPLKVFPTMILLDKNGVVSDITPGFYGPGAGEYHRQYKARFEKKVSALLAQQF